MELGAIDKDNTVDLDGNWHGQSQCFFHLPGFTLCADLHADGVGNEQGLTSDRDITGTSGRKRPIVLDSDDEVGSEHHTPLKKKHVSLGNPTAVGDDGFLADINVQPINEEIEMCEDKRRDIDQFFHQPVTKEVSGKQKKYCICKVCLIYQGKYQKWVQENKLGSKLPGDVKKCKADAERVMRTLDRDLKEKKLKERVAKYTHKEFCRAAIEWLVATDQCLISTVVKPIQALEHLKFKRMIDLASRATDGVKIPGQKSTWVAIKQSFQSHLKNLKAQLNSPKVMGEVNLTCDAWQAGNTDGYFAVTGHWIEETAPMQWELKSALVGFT
ncbi:hypothetical protein C0995_014485 [Termitomyces sp. Mi166|nr:hypothetical protein C0995_014485 [Termitomyces sp. Mi166\